MPKNDESKTVGYCAYSGQVLKGKQLLEGGFHTTSDGVTHRLVRWAQRRYEWAGDQLRHKVTGRLFDIHPNAKADAFLAPQIEEHEDPNEPPKVRKSKKVEPNFDETTDLLAKAAAAQPVTQDALPTEDVVADVEAEPEAQSEPGESEEAAEEYDDGYAEVEAVADSDEDEVVD